jgi:PAS domain S-box-containing protein
VAAVRDLGIVSGAMVRVSTESGSPAYLASFCTKFREYTEQDLNFLQSAANIIAATAGRSWMENALQTAERSVHTLLTSMPLIFWAWDADGVFTLSQGAGLEQLGLRPGQVVGQNVRDVYKDMPEILDHSRRALSGEAFDATVDIGESVWDVRYRPLRNDAGGVVGVLGVALDVADRRRAEEGVRRIFQMSQDLLCVGSLEGQMLSVNPAFSRTLGWSEEELLSQSPLAIVHPDDREASVAELRRVAAGQTTSGFENRCRSKDGGYRWLSWVATPVLETGLVYAAARDVTDAKISQRALEASEEKFAKAFHSSPTLMTIARISDGRFVEVNDSCVEAFGYTRDEMIGSSGLELGLWVDPLARKSLIDELVAEGAIRHREVEYVAKNGDRRIGLLSAEVIMLGSEAYSISLVDDITLRKRAEEALVRSEAEYRHVVDHAIYGIYRSNERGTLLSVNHALVEMLGYDDADDLMAVNMARDLYATDGERERLMDHYRERGRIQNLDVEWRRKDGSPVIVRLSGLPLRASDSGELQFEMFVEDVTERRGLEAQLQQAQKMEAIGQLTGGIAHDFNNILTAVLGNAEILAADLPPEFANLQAEVADIRSAAQRGAGMIRKLMTFSRRETLEMQAIDPDQLCRDTTAMLRRILSENIEIKVRPGDVRRTVHADRGAIEQVLVNLATNARDAMEGGGTLTVETHLIEVDQRQAAQHGVKHVGEYVVISVSDTGIGMDEATLAHIFEPFFTTKPTGRGTGLGMAMVYGLVSRHNGFVEIDSTVGEGTTVRVAFPAAEMAATFDAAPSPPVELPRGCERVLLVEDEPVLRKMGERILTRFGYRVVTADDGRQAWEFISNTTENVDLIVTDMVMPHVSGGELFRRVRATDAHMPFLFTTGYAASELNDEALGAEDVPLLQKPWTVEELVRGVRAVLDNNLA